MSDPVSLNELENISALSLAGGMESQQQNKERQGARGSSSAGGADSVRLSPEAEKQVQKLRERDREVRAHEQAHIAAGGQHVSGGASFSYQTGPDGRQYAVGGSVQIDTSPVPGDPKATEEKARAVRRAALAPASPSSSDQNVAAKAAAMENKSRSEQAELTSPLYGALWQSGVGNGEYAFSMSSSRPWPGPERAAAIYAAMRDSALPQTALAPWGTGISLTV